MNYPRLCTITTGYGVKPAMQTPNTGARTPQNLATFQTKQAKA